MEMRTNIDLLKKQIVERITTFPQVQTSTPNQQLYLSNETNRLLDLAEEKANNLKDSYMSIEHIILGICELSNSKIQSIEEQISKLQNLAKKVNLIHEKNNSYNYNINPNEEILKK